MLHLETVEPGTFAVLERLMRLKVLQPFSLVGGTALSLRYGHRTSFDIDLFYENKFEHEPIVKAQKKNSEKDMAQKASITAGGYSVILMG